MKQTDIRRLVVRLITISTFASAGLVHAVDSNITLDGHTPTTVNPRTGLLGTNFEIGGGERRGTNLFHSFGRFDVGTNDASTFIGPSSIRNIISRVTGPHISMIDGTLASDIPGADLWLINPAGVVFGENSSLDLQGSLHVSTADYLRLGEDGRFDATNPGDSVLTVDPPAAFGFLDDTIAAIDVNRTRLKVPAGETISLVGGNISIIGAESQTLEQILEGLLDGGLFNDYIPGLLTALEVIPGDTQVGELLLNQVDWGNLRSVLNPGVNATSLLSSSLTVRQMLASNMNMSQFVSQVINAGIMRDNLNPINVLPASLGVDTLVNALLTNFSPAELLTSGLLRLNLTLLNIADIAANPGNWSISGILNPSVDFGELVRVGLSGSSLTVSDVVRSGFLATSFVRPTLTGGQLLDSSAFNTGLGRSALNGGLPASQLLDGNLPAFALRVAGVFANIAIDIGDRLGIDILPHGLLAEGGRINLASVAAPGEVTINGGAVGGVAGGGTITLRDAVLATIGILDGVAGQSPGEVYIRGGDFYMETSGGLLRSTSIAVPSTQVGGSTVTIDVTGDIQVTNISAATLSGLDVDEDDRGGIFINAGGDVEVLGTITTRSFGTLGVTDVVVPAGDISINAGGTVSVCGSGPDCVSPLTSIFLGDFTGIKTETSSGGRGGDLTINAGAVEVKGGARISALTNGSGNAGDINIDADEVSVRSAGRITALTEGSGDGGGISIAANEVSIDSGGRISVATDGSGNAGDIDLTTGVLNVRGGGRIDGSTSGSGSAGNVAINSSEVAITNGGRVDVSTFAAGDAGSLTINADLVSVSGTNSRIVSESANEAAGSAGDITVNAATINITEGGRVSAITRSADESNELASLAIVGSELNVQGLGSDISVTTESGARAGDITIDVGRVVVSDGGRVASASTTATAGAAGSITVTADEVELSNGGEIVATTNSDRADNEVATIEISATDLSLTGGSGVSVSTSGQSSAGELVVTSDSLSVTGSGSRIASSSDSSDAGAAGSIDLNVGSLDVSGGGRISAATNSNEADNRVASINITGQDVTVSGAASGIFVVTTGRADAGNVSVDSENLLVTESGIVSASTSSVGSAGGISLGVMRLEITDQGAVLAETSGGGTGGMITVNAQEAEVLSGGTISVATRGSGDALSLQLNATERLTIDGGVISSSSFDSGAGGGLQIDAAQIDLINDGRVMATSEGRGSAGSVDIAAQHVYIADGGALLTESLNSAGGNINLRVDDFLYMLGGTIVASANGLGAADNGGNVTLQQPTFAILNNSRIQANANTGNGGNITISAGTFLQSADSVVEASSQTGLDGAIEIDSLNDITGEIVELEVPYLNVLDLLRDRCSAQALRERSSFVVQGPLLPPSPSDYRSSPLSRLSEGKAATTYPVRQSTIGEYGIAEPGCKLVGGP